MAAVEKIIRHGPPPMEIDKRFWGKEPQHANLSSEYVTRFLGGPSPRAQPHYPRDNGCFTYDVTSPLNPNTLYGVNYTDHEGKKKAIRRKTKPTPLCLRPPSLDGGDVTIYNDEYKLKNAVRPKNIKPDPPDHRPTEGNQTNQRITLKQEMHRLFTAEEAKDAIRTPFQTHNNIIWHPEEPHVGSVNTTENPFLEIPPGLKKPKQNFSVMNSIQQTDYSFKPTKPRDLFLPVRWRAPKIQFENKSTFQDEFHAYERKLHRPASFKPIHKFRVPDNSRAAQPTTHGLDFERKADKMICPEPNQMMKRPPLPEKGKFQAANQYKDVYTDKSKLRQYSEPHRPRQMPSLKFKTKFLNNATTHKASYVPHDPNGVALQHGFLEYDKNIGEKTNYVSASTMRDHFRGTKGKQRSIHRPKVLDRIE